MKKDHRKSREELVQELAEARESFSRLERRVALHNAEALGGVFEHHLDVVLYIDAVTGSILWVNRAAIEFYGYTRDELIRMHVSDLNILDRSEIHILMQQIRERTRSRFHFTHRLKNRELRNVEVYSVPVELGGREVLCSFVRDVTGLTESKVSLEKNAAMQDTVLSAMDIVPFYCHNRADYELIYVGASVEAVTGFSPKSFYRDLLLWRSRIHPGDTDKLVGRFGRLATTGSTRCEYRWKVEDGSYRWFSLSMRLVPCDNSDEIDCIAGLFWNIDKRKRTEKALIEREERYRTVADFAHDWVFWIGSDGEFLYVSPSFERVTGYKPSELKGNASLLFESIVHPQDRERVRSIILDGMLSEDPLSFDFRIVTKDGEIRWIDQVSQAVHDDKGDPLGRRASNRDITELKETIQALKDKNQFIDSIMDNAPASIYAKDVDGRYLFGNARFMGFTGKPFNEVLGKTDFGLFDNDVAELFCRGDAHVVSSGEAFLEDVDVVRNGRNEHWTSSKFPLVNAGGDVLGVCGISLDVTEWREAEASLRRLTRAVEQSPVSIVMTDIKGCIRFVNPYFCEVSGYTEAEALGRDLGFMLAREDAVFYVSIWEKVMCGEDWHGEIRNRTKAGEILWENTSISPVRDSRDRIINFVAVKDNITERKRLERLERDVEHIVRHDLKSPMMSFIWVPKMLRRADNITEEQAVLLGDLEQSAHRLLKMVNLSQDIFKMEEGTYSFVPEDLNIVRVIQNILRDLDKTIRAMRVNVEVFVADRRVADQDYLVVRGEELLCYSMLSNLIKNAVEASPKDGVVTISCRSEEYSVIRIHNEFHVPEEILESFFEKYSTQGKRFGTGLGTYSARLIAETQGGFIDMQSTKEAGTNITVTFPASPACPGDDGS
jgi:PAS domain S-box-containing protein